MEDSTFSRLKPQDLPQPSFTVRLLQLSGSESLTQLVLRANLATMRENSHCLVRHHVFTVQNPRRIPTLYKHGGEKKKNTTVCKRFLVLLKNTCSVARHEEETVRALQSKFQISAGAHCIMTNLDRYKDDKFQSNAA